VPGLEGGNNKEGEMGGAKGESKGTKGGWKLRSANQMERFENYSWRHMATSVPGEPRRGKRTKGKWLSTLSPVVVAIFC
jgi:hypothetical protein